MKKIVLLIILAGIGVLFLSNKKNEIPKDISKTETEQKPTEQDKCVSTDYKECKDFPWLDLPLKYFSVNDVRWGSAGGKGKEGTMEQYTQVALDGKEIYQSYPTTKTTIKDFSSEVVPITALVQVFPTVSVIEVTEPKVNAFVVVAPTTIKFPAVGA